VLASSGAWAAELNSAAIPGLGTNNCRCGLTNVSTKTIEATVEFINGIGNVAASGMVILDPARSVVVSDTACGANNPHFCRITGSFSRSKVRAVYCVTASGSSTTEGICVPVL